MWAGSVVCRPRTWLRTWVATRCPRWKSSTVATVRRGATSPWRGGGGGGGWGPGGAGRVGVEDLEKLGDAGVERGEREDPLVARAREDPAGDDEPPRLDLGFIAWF